MEKKLIPVSLLVISLISILLFSENIQSAYALSFTQYTGGTFTCTTYSAQLSKFAVFYLSGGFLQGEILSVSSTGVITQTLTVSNIASASALDSSENCAYISGNTVYVSSRPTNQNSIISAINMNTGVITAQTQLTGTDSGCIAENVVVYGGSVWTIGYGSGANDCDVNGVGTSNNVVYQFTLALTSRIDSNTGLGMASSCNDIYITYLGVTGRCGNALLYDNSGVWTTFASSATTWTECDGSHPSQIYCIRSNTVYEIDTAGNSIFIAAANWRAIVRSDSSGQFWLTDNTATLKLYTSAGVLAGNAVAPEQVDVKSFQTSQNIVTANGVSSGDPTIMLLNDNGELSDDSDTDSGSGNQVDGVCGVGTALECIGNRSTMTQITGAQNLTTVVGTLGTQLGLLNSTANPDAETNGSGLILMLSTGALFSSVTISAIAVANNKFGANIQYTEIPKEYWLFLVIGVIALAFYLNWIPDIVFYGMVVGLAGLFSFGLYTKYKGNG